MSKYGRVTAELKNLPENEPVFVLRAKDILAPMALEMYANLLRAAAHGSEDAPWGADALEQQARDVDDFAARMIVWQAEHAKVVRLPD